MCSAGCTWLCFCRADGSFICLSPCAGCTLPVEMFFPDGEMPTAPLEVALARLGVACRRLSTGTGALSGFTLKAAATLLSSFEEVRRPHP